MKLLLLQPASRQRCSWTAPMTWEYSVHGAVGTRISWTVWVDLLTSTSTWPKGWLLYLIPVSLLDHSSPQSVSLGASVPRVCGRMGKACVWINMNAHAAMTDSSTPQENRSQTDVTLGELLRFYGYTLLSDQKRYHVRLCGMIWRYMIQYHIKRNGDENEMEWDFMTRDEGFLHPL